jgi:putative DNA primase/helicase
MQSTVTGTLVVPEIPDDADLLTAALLYAKAGWYVLAVEPDTKRPANFYGKGWQHMSSRDPQEIISWFTLTPYMLALHVGRSGGVAFDIDAPEYVPAVLQRAFDEERPPMQSTRKDGGRGHRVFHANGRRLGNSRGALGKENKNWGEVRGRNGIIVVEPSAHSKYEEGGRYKWLTTGIVPTLPHYISELLPDAGEDAEAATDAQVAAFMDEHTDEKRGALMKVPLEKLSEDLREAVEKGTTGRHEALVNYLCMAMREARYGWYPAKVVADTMEIMFLEAMGQDRHPRSEFHGVLAFAVAQALLIDPDERAKEASDRLKARDAMKKASINVGKVPDRPYTRPRDPDDYFVDRERGIDMELLAQDVIGMGHLALGPNNDFWVYKAGVWKPDRKELNRRVVRLLGPRYRNSHANNVDTFVKSEAPEITCDPVPEYINFVNGMLDWRTQELRPHAPHYGSTVQLPLEWDENTECPQFDDFLKSILSDDYIELAWQMIGYLMYSGNPKQKAFMFLGSGANGKGTLLRVIEALLGKENCSAESLDDLNQNRFAAYSLFAKIANIAGDIDATYQTSTAAFKKLTGEDLYYGEQKYGDRFGFKSWAVPVFSANKIPGSSDTSVGYLRRWIVLRFDRTFTESERIDGLSDRLITELPGIAKKAVAALKSVIDDNFKMDGEVEQGQEEFAQAIDQVRQWLDECTIYDPEARVKRGDAYASYRMWANSYGHRVLSANEFYTRVTGAAKHGHKIEKKIQGVRMFVGFRIADLASRAQDIQVENDAFGSDPHE